MLKRFIQSQKTLKENEIKNLIIPNVKLTQKPVARYLNIKSVYQCDLAEFKEGDNNYRYALVFVNTTNGMGYVYLLQNKNADVVIAETEKFIKSHRDIEYLESDNGSEFINAKMRRLLEYWKVEHKTSHVGKSTQTSIVDNYIFQMRKLVNISIVASNRKSWKEIIIDAVKTINDHRKENYKVRKANEVFKMPILPPKREMLDVGDKVHLAKFKFHDTMRLRTGDQKFENDVRKVEHVALRNGGTVKYKISGVPRAMFDRRDINKHIG